MLFYSNYTLKLSTLLTNQRLLELSYNQILDRPLNVISDLNLSPQFFIENKLLMLNNIKKFIKTRIFFVYNSKKPELSPKHTNSFLKKLFIQNLVIKQSLANILSKVFKNKKKLLPPNFYIIDTNRETLKKLSEVFKKTNLGIFCNNLEICTKITFRYFIKILKSAVVDQHFISFVTNFFACIEINTLFTDKSSKFYKIFCNIYLAKFDFFILNFFKNHVVKSTPKFVNNKFKVAKKVAPLVASALLTAKARFFFMFKQIYSKKCVVAPILFYIRYLNHFFFGTSFLKPSLLNFSITISYFFKSTLHFNIKIQKWVNLHKKSSFFFGIHKTRLFKFFTKRLLFVKNLCPINKLTKELLKFGVLYKSKKPKAIIYLITLYTNTIIIWYNNLIFGILYYYSKTANYLKLFNNTYYCLKWSLLYTLKKKHKKALEKISIKYWTQQNNNLLVTITKNNINMTRNLAYIYKYKL